MAGVAVGPSGVPAYADDDGGCGDACAVVKVVAGTDNVVAPKSYSFTDLEGMAVSRGQFTPPELAGDAPPPSADFSWFLSLATLLTKTDGEAVATQTWVTVVGDQGTPHNLDDLGPSSFDDGVEPGLYDLGKLPVYIRPLTSAQDRNVGSSASESFVSNPDGPLQITFHTTGHPLDVTLDPAGPISTKVGVPVAFTASVAGDAPPGGYHYTWQFESDQSGPDSPTANGTWTKPCVCAAQVWVTDPTDGSSGYAATEVDVGNPSPTSTPTPTPTPHPKRPHKSHPGPSTPPPPPPHPTPTSTPTVTPGPTPGQTPGAGGGPGAGSSAGPSGKPTHDSTKKPSKKATKKTPDAEGTQVTGTLLLAADHSGPPPGSVTTTDPSLPAASPGGDDHPLTVPGWLLLIAGAVVVLSLGMVREARTPRRRAGVDRRRSEDG